MLTEPDRYDYLPLIDRPIIRWPNGARIILSLSISSWLLGYPHRIGTLEKILDVILQSDSVWHATGIDIVAAFKAQLPHE
jgi:hypothetical protein